MKYLSFCVWIISCNIMFYNPVVVGLKNRIFLFKAEKSSFLLNSFETIAGH